MGKRVLVITSSYRKRGNTARLAEEFARGAAEAGHQVETIHLAEQTIQFCRGCMACMKLGKCVLKDDAAANVQKMHDADVLVFVTPIYYYEMSGQLKTMLDRANPLFEGDYKFTEIYALTAAAEQEESTPDRAVQGIEGWIECFGRAHLAGAVFAGGVAGPGEVEGHPALKQAYEMGRQV